MESAYSRLATESSESDKTWEVPKPSLKSRLLQSTAVRVIVEIIAIGLLYMVSFQVIAHYTKAPEPNGYSELSEGSPFSITDPDKILR